MVLIVIIVGWQRCMSYGVSLIYFDCIELDWRHLKTFVLVYYLQLFVIIITAIVHS